ncbi:hypothetical protein O3P69_018628 [Scylla paramamosain]|uniref:Aspartic peptidase DDI1-type domain-containing protein n=1 Tax=Scylla paramamosain TaxID=85552 RepID=A0AAW0T2M5_SCYPA
MVDMVNGHPAQLLVDMGSKKTFMREDLVEVCGVPEVAQWLCGITGKCVALQSPVMVNISVGGMMECMTVFIAILEDPYLLEIDFLIQLKVAHQLLVEYMGSSTFSWVAQRKTAVKDTRHKPNEMSGSDIANNPASESDTGDWGD